MVIARCASHAFSSIVMNGDLCTLALSHTSTVAPVPGTAQPSRRTCSRSQATCSCLHCRLQFGRLRLLLLHVAAAADAPTTTPHAAQRSRAATRPGRSTRALASANRIDRMRQRAPCSAASACVVLTRLRRLLRPHRASMWHLSAVAQTGSNRRPIQWYEMSSRCVLNSGNLTVKSSHIDNIKIIKNIKNIKNLMRESNVST